MANSVGATCFLLVIGGLRVNLRGEKKINYSKLACPFYTSLCPYVCCRHWKGLIRLTNMNTMKNASPHTIPRAQQALQPRLQIPGIPPGPQQPRNQPPNPPQRALCALLVRIRAANRLDAVIHRAHPRAQPYPLRRRRRQRRVQDDHADAAASVGWVKGLFVLGLVVGCAAARVEVAGAEGRGDADYGKGGKVDGSFWGWGALGSAEGVACAEEGVKGFVGGGFVC